MKPGHYVLVNALLFGAQNPRKDLTFKVASEGFTKRIFLWSSCGKEKATSI